MAAHPDLLRADSGFARDELMDWCEQNRVDFVNGLAHTQFAEATCGTLRLALLKIGATDDACMSRRAVLNGTWETEP